MGACSIHSLMNIPLNVDDGIKSKIEEKDDFICLTGKRVRLLSVSSWNCNCMRSEKDTLFSNKYAVLELGYGQLKY